MAQVLSSPAPQSSSCDHYFFVAVNVPDHKVQALNFGLRSMTNNAVKMDTVSQVRSHSSIPLGLVLDKALAESLWGSDLFIPAQVVKDVGATVLRQLNAEMGLQLQRPSSFKPFQAFPVLQTV